MIAGGYLALQLLEALRGGKKLDVEVSGRGHRGGGCLAAGLSSKERELNCPSSLFSISVQLEKGIMASGFLLLTSLGMFLIVRDAISLLS